MLEVKNLRFRYAKRSPLVLDGVTLELSDGEIGILLGRNGSGKTTLFRTILGIERPQGGQLLFDGRDMLSLTRRERAHLTAYVPQDVRFGALSVFDTVMMGRLSHFGLQPAKEDKEAVWRILQDMRLEELSGRNASALSGGEMQKVAIARALAQEPRLLIFDEPTGSLDIANEQLILSEARRAAKEKGIAILTSLHDLNQALALGERFFFMKNGRVLYAGGPEIVTEETIEEIYDVRVRIADIEGKRVIINGGDL